MSYEFPNEEEKEVIEANDNWISNIENLIRLVIRDENSTAVEDSVALANYRKSLSKQMFEDAMIFDLDET